MYTRVLLGNLSIEKCKFRIDSELTGAHFDSLARQYLWHEYKDYSHGTGHGVGFFLNVHEGPQGISMLQKEVKLAAGMLITNEPGFYLKNKFGIRIENNLLVSHSKENPDFYFFDNLTLVPYEKKLFDLNLISKDMIAYTNEYHNKIKNTIEPLLGNSDEDQIARDYLLRKTKPIIIN